MIYPHTWDQDNCNGNDIGWLYPNSHYSLPLVWLCKLNYILGMCLHVTMDIMECVLLMSYHAPGAACIHWEGCNLRQHWGTCDQSAWQWLHPELPRSTGRLSQYLPRSIQCVLFLLLLLLPSSHACMHSHMSTSPQSRLHPPFVELEEMRQRLTNHLHPLVRCEDLQPVTCLALLTRWWRSMCVPIAWPFTQSPFSLSQDKQTRLTSDSLTVVLMLLEYFYMTDTISRAPQTMPMYIQVSVLL